MKTWSLFFAALGLAMVLEGLPYFISPRRVRDYLRLLERTGDGALRVMGFLLMVAGLAITYFSTR